MRAIEKNCPECLRRNVLDPSRIRVDHWPAHEDLSTYSFTCKHCGRLITCPAPLDVLALLGFARCENWHEHRLPPEATRRPVAPPLTDEDLADFLIELNLTPAHLISQLAEE